MRARLAPIAIWIFSVAFLALGRWDDAGMLAVARGQLPRQHAVPASTLDPGGDSPDFAIAIDAPLDDPRYERIYDSPAGSIRERVR